MTLDQLSSEPRVTVRRKGPPDPDGTCVVYWMQRAQRAIDNPALDLAVRAANLLRKPCVIFFAPIPFYPNANLRHYKFLAEGIADVARAARERNAGFVLGRWPDHSLAAFCDQVRPALVVGDENPLREPQRWREVAAKRLRVPLWTVDADVVVPSRLFPKAQYAAFHLRRKLQLHLPAFLTEPENERAEVAWRRPAQIESLDPLIGPAILDGWPLDRSVAPVSTFHGGTTAALKRLHDFIANKLVQYPDRRNRPEEDFTSRLSPYLHFGHISPQRVAWEVAKADVPIECRERFLDELITWRELSVNFVLHNPTYDTFECADAWAHRTLAEHARDPRPVLYSDAQLENAETGDDLWNAAQRQMITAGWMHNTMRMYWAKKILEWSPSPAEAFARAVRLNDRYFLDGRDPNGYAGVAWSILGKFDRPWFERPVFGKVRYMSRESTGKKFNSAAYIAQWSGKQETLFGAAD